MEPDNQKEFDDDQKIHNQYYQDDWIPEAPTQARVRLTPWLLLKLFIKYIILRKKSWE